MESIKHIPAAIQIVTIIFMLIAPMLAVFLTNYLQNKRMTESIVSSTDKRLEIFKAKTDGEFNKIETKIEDGFISYPKHNESMTRVYGRVETIEELSKQMFMDIKDMVHKIELHASDIAGQVKGIKTICNMRGNQIEKLEDKINNRS